MAELSAYRSLEARFHRLNALRGALSVLHWDMSAMMPPGGMPARGEQLAALRLVCHELLTAPELGDLLEAAEGEDGLDPWRRANLREMRREWAHATALAPPLVEALSKAATACEAAWRKARPAADYGLVRPHLEALLKLVREAAAAKADRLGLAPYDALLDEYEPGGRSAEIDRLFEALAAFLPELRERAQAAQAARPAPVEPAGPFPVAAQRALCEELMRTLGFEFEHGRLDTSLHPFCGGVPDDVRITTRYDERDFTGALMGVLHETGHALYERGLPADWRLQPAGQARGMSLHESQSLLIEMQACRSRPFLRWLAPRLEGAFGADPAWEPENLYALATRIRPGFIRVDADEVTYPAHVVLRYRLERAMVAGELHPADLPAAWNEGMRALIGLVPPSDREGCLQDIHWYDGAWGYFPTYTLGAMTAAQLFEAACVERPEIPDALGEGDFAPLVAWLRRRVHGQGSLLPAAALIEQATGRPLDPAIFRGHLERRYLA